MNKLKIIEKDPWLTPFSQIIQHRNEKALKKYHQITDHSGSLADFSNGHLFFGVHSIHNEWVFREWAPNATKIYLIGTFNQWTASGEYAFTPFGNGNWELKLPEHKIHHKDLYKLLIVWDKGQGERIPAYATRVVQDKKTLIFNAQIWKPEKPYPWKSEKFKKPIPNLVIYEAHIGMATEEPKVGSYNEFRKNILPHVIKTGYNVIQLMAIQEHPYYGSFGYHVSGFFAASSRFGTPEELKQLIDEAHEAGIGVIMDLVHSHAVKNETEGLGKYDGTRYQFFHEGPRGEHPAWNSYCFNYKKEEVVHFLLSNIKYWMEEFRFDGFRFDGITSMLYTHHGLERDFTQYEQYFDGSQDEDAITYLMLTNQLVHEINPNAITVAEEMSGYPGVATPITDGGIGFDFRLAMGIPDFWIKIIKELPDDNWDMHQLFHELTNKRTDEKTVNYPESHDQALVGDKTIIFRLIDKEMYDGMAKSVQHITVERGIALHKMIRMITFATAGNGYLTFMGNEFGHPEWIDFPREGNNWSFHYARRQWSLLHNHMLRYEYLYLFEKNMLHIFKNNEKFWSYPPTLITANNDDKILAFSRGDFVFVFNFHPRKSYTDYGILTRTGKYRMVLDTDHKNYGGYGNIDPDVTHRTSGEKSSDPSQWLKIYIPSRTGILLHKEKIKSIFG